MTLSYDSELSFLLDDHLAANLLMHVHMMMMMMMMMMWRGRSKRRRMVLVRKRNRPPAPATRRLPVLSPRAIPQAR